jgi:hypothetical protein
MEKIWMRNFDNSCGANDFSLAYIFVHQYFGLQVHIWHMLWAKFFELNGYRQLAN